jgi:GTP-binding protein
MVGTRSVGRGVFVAGAARLEHVPPPRLPEIAIAGRSNVGKSSLLNRLVGQRGLARVSKTPGRTQQINFFSIDDQLLLVDLPGYGFARVPLAIKHAWRGLVEGYLSARRPLRAVIVLVDARRGIEPDDRQLLAFLADRGIPARIAMTKIDKIGRGARRQQLDAIAAAAPAVPVIACSAASGEGVAELWRTIVALT